MENNRQKIYDFLKDKKAITTTSYPDWKSKYFSSESGVVKVFDYLKEKKYYTLSLNDFYKKYACDLLWANKSQYCVGSVVTPPKPPTPPVTTEWLSDPTGSKKYVYQLRNCKWIAKNTSTDKEFNISDNPKYDSSVQILNNAHPELIKKCKSGGKDTVDTTDGGQTNTTNTTTTTTVKLPEWANCLTTLGKKAISTTDSDGKSVVLFLFGKDKCYLWEDGTSIYTDVKTGERLNGVWSCVGGKLIIKFDEWGWMWSLATGWVEQATRTQNDDQNFGTSWTSPEELSVGTKPKPNPFSELSKTKLPEFKGYDPNKPMSLNQNESTMDNLENIITEIEELVNSELISEQRVQVIQAPKDELNILRTNPMLKATGTLEALCRTNNGTSKPVNVNNKIYFAGKSFIRKSTNKPAYLTYDGMVLERQGESCNFTYAKDAKGVLHVKGIPYSDLELPYTEVLTQFGINPKDYNSDPYFSIDSISKDLQNLVKQGAVSTVFKSWNDMLYYYHPDDYANFALTREDGKSLTPPTNRGELSQYRVLNGRNYGLMYNNKDVVIYMPATASPQVSGGGKKEFDPTKCKEAIVEYLSAAIRFEVGQDPSANPTINNSDNRTFIKGCYGANMYKDLKVGTTDLPDIPAESRIFKWFRGKTLSIKEVSYLLSGKDKNLPSGKNPYLPFPIRKNDMNETKVNLNNVIKENLTKLSEEKQNNLLAETKIIQTRTKLLLENRILKFKQPREKFFNEIISETIYLEKQGFDKELIKEEFWNKIKGLFGDHGSEAIFGTFKEYMSKWLVGKLTSVNPNGWMGTAIKKSVNDIHVDDIDKLTDCEFMTKRVSLSITDEIVKKVKNDEEVDGGISNIVKGGLTNSIDRTELLRNIESGVSKIICPELGNVGKKLEDKAEEMKSKAIKP
jgi:hypothetical protein